MQGKSQRFQISTFLSVLLLRQISWWVRWSSHLHFLVQDSNIPFQFLRCQVVIRRESCLFLSFFSESQTISCWWSAEGQIKISLLAISKFWQSLRQQKILSTFTWWQGQWLRLKHCKAFSPLSLNYSVWRPASWIKPCLRLRFHGNILNLKCRKIKKKLYLFSLVVVRCSSILQVEQQKVTGFFPTF